MYKAMGKMNEIKRNTIKDAITNWDSGQIIEAWNRCCEDSNMPDDTIYYNGDDFFEEMFNGRMMEAIRAVVYGKYEVGDDYVRFNGYGNLETFSYWDDNESPVDIDVLIDWLIDTEDTDTPDINDELTEAFINGLVEEDKSEIAKLSEEEITELMESYDEEEISIGLLIDDWDELVEELERYYKERQEE